jgi:hypothetical protein
MSKRRVIEVVADWVGLGGPTLMGCLTATPARGKEVFAFEYDGQWLSMPSRQQLDPSMADPHGAGLKLNISETDNAQEIELALSVASVFRVRTTRAHEIVTTVTDAVRAWRSVATARGVPRTAQNRMQRAFRVAETWASS